MPYRPSQKLNLSLTPRAFWAWAAALTLLRLAVTAFQQGYTWVGGAPLDDELMFRAANAITAGQWLGTYDYLTLSKAMFFPVWLALLHALHLPYLTAGAALWCVAAGLAAAALRPLWAAATAGHGRTLTLGLYAALAFLPSSWAAYTLRVYRDNIFPALCLLVFAGFAGALLRAAQNPAAQTGTKPPRLWPWLLAAGAGLAAGYLDREDAGLFLLPAAALATLALVVLCVRRRRWLSLAAQLLPYGLLAGGALAFCTLNYTHYGVFTLSDFSSGSFADAMGAMSRVATASEEPQLSVPADARALLYEAVPELEPLAYWLEEDPQMRNDFRDPELEDYRAGSFYWAIRRAAQFEGIYDSAAGAESYWATVAEKINAACASGALPVRAGDTGVRSGTTQPIRARYVLPTLQECFRSLYWVLTFQDCAPYESLRSIGTEEDIALWSGYLGCGFNAAAEAGRDTPYYSPQQKAVFRLLDALRLCAALLTTLCFVLAVLCQLRALPRLFGKAAKGVADLGWRRLAWALPVVLLAFAALRCAMIAFVEVSSFGIGTSTMYLATVHPLVVLFNYASLWPVLIPAGRGRGDANV